MHPFLEHFLTRQKNTGAADFAGADASVRIPLREGVVNEFLSEMVVKRNSSLTALSLTIKAGNRLDVYVASPKLPIWGEVTLPCTLDPMLIISPSPAVRVQIVSEGVAGYMIATVLPLVSRFLPPEVTLSAGVLTIDLGRQLASRGLAWAIPFIKSGSFKTESGVLWLTLDLHAGSSPHTSPRADTATAAIPAEPAADSHHS
jgi:hypothetical protein